MHLPAMAGVAVAVARRRPASSAARAALDVGGAVGAPSRVRRPSASAAAGRRGSAPFLPVIRSSSASSASATNRVVFALLDPTGTKPVAAPDRTPVDRLPRPERRDDPVAPRRRSSGRSRASKGVYVGHATFPTPGSWIADFTSGAPGSPGIDRVASASTSSPTRRRLPGRSGAVGRRRRRSPTSAATSTKISTRHEPRPALLRDVGGRRPGREEAVRPGLRDAEVLQVGHVRPDARQGQADRRRISGRDVHQRRAVPADGRDGSLQPVLTRTTS